MNDYIYLIFLIVTTVLLVLFFINNINKQEGFSNLLGQLGPYKEELNECLNRVDRSDPSDRLSYPSNLFGDMYCNSTITEKARMGIPPEKNPKYNNISICREHCDIPGLAPDRKRKCVNKCYGLREVADKCSIEICPYSKMNTPSCMNDCISRWNVNNTNLSWNWKP
jgi:hypothetical protein